MLLSAPSALVKTEAKRTQLCKSTRGKRNCFNSYVQRRFGQKRSVTALWQTVTTWLPQNTQPDVPVQALLQCKQRSQAKAPAADACASRFRYITHSRGTTHRTFDELAYWEQRMVELHSEGWYSAELRKFLQLGLGHLQPFRILNAGERVPSSHPTRPGYPRCSRVLST